MSTAVKKRIKFTYDDYLHFSEDKRYEIIDGEVYMVPSPGEAHQNICANLAFTLRVFVKKKKKIIWAGSILPLLMWSFLRPM